MKNSIMHEHVSDNGPRAVYNFINFSGENEPFEYIGHIWFIGEPRKIISDVYEFENAENEGQNSYHHDEGITILSQQHSLPVTILS